MPDRQCITCPDNGLQRQLECAQDRAFTLSGCPPPLNCVSSQSVVPLYNTDPFVLQAPYSPGVWENIKLQALSLSGAELGEKLGEERDGYLYVKCYSRVFKEPLNNSVPASALRNKADQGADLQA